MGLDMEEEEEEEDMGEEEEEEDMEEDMGEEDMVEDQEEGDGGVPIGVIDIDHPVIAEDMVGIVLGIGLVDYVKMDALILDIINGVANIQVEDLTIVGPQQIVMVADIKFCGIYY